MRSVTGPPPAGRAERRHASWRQPWPAETSLPQVPAQPASGGPWRAAPPERPGPQRRDRPLPAPAAPPSAHSATRLNDLCEIPCPMFIRRSARLAAQLQFCCQTAVEQTSQNAGWITARQCRERGKLNRGVLRTLPHPLAPLRTLPSLGTPQGAWLMRHPPP